MTPDGSGDQQWQRPKGNGSAEDGADGPEDPEDPETAVLEDRDDAGPPPLPLDAIFEILKNQRRRTTLRYLKEEGDPVELRDLAEHVAIQENDIEPEELTSTMRKRAYVGLYQCHLPKMDELGAVEFNRDRGIIELGPNVDQLEPYLDAPDESEPWPQYYLALAGVNVTLFGGWLAAGAVLGDELSTLGTAVVGTVAILSFAALALVHHLRWTDENAETGRDGD